MRWALLPLLLLAAACGDRRSFDERYADTQEELQEKARNIDEQLANNAANETAP